MTNLKELTQVVVNFRNARDWQQFHSAKDMAYGLMLESAELAQHFQWKNSADTNTYLSKHKTEVSNELADVLYWVLLMAHDLDIDIAKVFLDKMESNEAKYPVEKARGSNKKYSEL